MILAVGLLSGGLDSTLAAKLLIDQGIEVHAVNFVSPFCTCTPKSAGCASIITAIRQLGDIPLKRITLGDDYLDMVKSPKFGYGRGMNPCIDCRIMKIRRAAEYMREIGAKLDGAYSLVFLDALGDMIVARDPLGIKPLCYAVEGRSLRSYSHQPRRRKTAGSTARSSSPSTAAHANPRSPWLHKREYPTTAARPAGVS